MKSYLYRLSVKFNIVCRGCELVAIFALGAFSACLATAAEGEQPATAEPREQVHIPVEVRDIAERLEQTLAEGTEARAMYDAIVSGKSMGPDAGWWRVSKSQRRFDWTAARERYDANSDGRLTREEFAGSNGDYNRLDYDEDGVVTEVDFTWADHPLEKSAGFAMFMEADADANGKVTREEFGQLFDRWDDGGHGFLALNDLRDRMVAAEPSGGRSGRRGPDIATLIRGLARQDIGSWQPGPGLDEIAPDFTLRTAVGGNEVTLSEKVGEKPVVLIFGNFTCGPFRSESGNLEKLYSRYRDRAEFLMVYVREAHPTDGWESPRNAQHDIRILQPTNDEQRQEVAQRCAAHLELPIPLLVDRIDDRVGTRYSGMPNRLYLIDREGKIAFKNGRGPFGFKTRELEQALVLLLNEEK